MKTAIKERPILFSGPMVRAILDGKKTVTRRVVNPPFRIRDDWPYRVNPEVFETGELTFEGPMSCPYGQPGDRLWVREAWRLYDASKECACYDLCLCHARHGRPMYRADWTGDMSDHKWRPSIHMPRRASRITLEVKSVRVERLQEITEAEAKAEGITKAIAAGIAPGTFYRAGFAQLWDNLNAERGHSWESNPWVWRVEFKKLEDNK